MKLIVETDIGHDPDDFFALCYLFAAEVDVQAILVTPGDESQVAIVRFLLDQLDKTDIPIGVPTIGRCKERPGSVHLKLLDKYNYPYWSDQCFLSDEILSTALLDTEIQFFICGPVKNIGHYLRKNTLSNPISLATMQGGFIAYEEHGLSVTKLEKFNNRKTVSTFNLNGDVEGAKAFLDAPICERRFVSKNVCHTVVYDTEVHERVTSTSPNSRASELLREGMSLYLAKHSKGKKFHDPTAAVCHLHPEIATWVRATLYRDKGQWGSLLDERGDRIIVDIDYDALWDHIANPRK